MEIDYSKLSNKKGIIVFGSSRSGTHHLGYGLYEKCDIKNKRYVGEIYHLDVDTANIMKDFRDLQKIQSFTFSQITHYISKNMLVQHINEIKNDYYLINIRRKNKIEQYRSWCMARLTWKYKASHSIDWSLIEKDLPLTITNKDIDDFIIQQNADYIWPADEIVFYEDIKLDSRYKKNIYKENFNELFVNPELIFERLSNFNYV